MLIRNADMWELGRGDLRIADGRIAEIGALEAAPGELVLDAAGGALLPGLHDHHIHLNALAARAASLWCGPPEVADGAALAERLREASGEGWIRAIGYHESVAGLPDARALDAIVANRPVRIQHRSGRMWLLNSLAVTELLERAPPPSGLERDASGKWTGHLFEEDDWLRRTLASRPPDLRSVSSELASCGVTGITDMSPANGRAEAAHFEMQHNQGLLVQHVVLAGTLELAEIPHGVWRLGPAKLHLHESALPSFVDACRFVAAAHDQARAVAIHCVTDIELAFAIAALDASGMRTGDRIEHASIADPDQVRQIADTGLAVVTQPHFIHERGDNYLCDVEARSRPDLYRLASLVAAGVPLAAGSDAPFGSTDPWKAMKSATTRATREGRVIGTGEALSPETALQLYLKDPLDLRRDRAIAVGVAADLCLLDHPWSAARMRLTAADVRATFAGGRQIHGTEAR